MVLSRKKLKRKRADEEAAEGALANPESAKEVGQVRDVRDGLKKEKEERKKKRDYGTVAHTRFVHFAVASDETDGNVIIENPEGGKTAAKNKKEKKKKKGSHGGSEVAAAGNEDILSSRTLNGAVNHSEEEAERTPDDSENVTHGEDGPSENGGQVNGGEETENGDHKGMTVRERKGKKKKRKDRWGGPVQEEQEVAVAAVSHEEEYKNQTSEGETDELSAGEQYDPKKVYVGGMPYYVTEEDIVDFFSECGKITELDCVLFPDTGKFRGLAFITFEAVEGASKALEWDGVEMGGRLLNIKKCKVKAPKGNKSIELGDVQKYEGCLSVYIGNLSWEITEDEIKKHLKKHYPQTKIQAIRLAYDKTSGEFKGFGHVEFGDDKSLEAAVNLNQTHLAGRPVKIAYSVPRRRPQSNENREGYKTNTCHSCGKEGHRAFTCPVKGGIIPERDGRVRSR